MLIRGPKFMMFTNFIFFNYWYWPII